MNPSHSNSEAIGPANGERCTSLARLLEIRAERDSEAIAVLAPGRSPLSFGGLHEHAQRVASALGRLGIGRSDRVAVVVPNGAEMATAFLGAASACTCAPLNPALRASEFDFYMGDMNARALLVQSATDCPAAAVARRRSIPVLELAPALEGDAGIFRFAEGASPPGAPAPAKGDDVALILYTSGTTGRPKMVPLTHSNLLSSALNIASTLQLTGQDRCLNVMPLFHIHGLVGALLASLAAGAGVVCTGGLQVENFFAWVREFRPTWYTAVPTMHQAILAEAGNRRREAAGSRLRFIRSSSSALPVRVMAELERIFLAPVIEAYGMTEAAHQIASNPLPPAERKMGSVGVAAGVEVGILDEAGRPVENGTAGEIVIRGASVMAEYTNGRENGESFHDGWFRTGDQGYFGANGYLFITGRLKEIINRGGEKISPREIDEALLEYPGILQAAAFPVPHPTLGEDVAAAIEIKEGERIDVAAVREYLFGRLANFKVPARLLVVDAIPKGPTGKLDRLELAAVFARELENDGVAPAGEIESRLAGIYAEVLGRQAVGASDNFFAMGGDSLRATQVISRVRAFFQVNLPIVTVFQKATVAELAQEIARFMETAERPPSGGVAAHPAPAQRTVRRPANGKPDGARS